MRENRDEVLDPLQLNVDKNKAIFKPMELSASIFECVEHTYAFYERIITRLWSETRKVPSIPEEIAFLKKHQAPFLSLAHTFLLSHPLTLCIHGFRHYGASFFSSRTQETFPLLCARPSPFGTKPHTLQTERVKFLRSPRVCQIVFIMQSSLTWCTAQQQTACQVFSQQPLAVTKHKQPAK